VDLLETVETTGQAAFAVDLRGEILAWNAAAEKLFHYPSSTAIGQRCWQLLAGRDTHGNDYCAESCPLRQMVRKHRPLNPSALVFRTSRNERVAFRVSLLVFSSADPTQSVVAHLLCPLSTEGNCAKPPTLQGKNIASRLTRREFEVLGLLIEGRTTHEIERGLGVSHATIRNHIQHILHKLHVHSRLEAVVLARAMGMDG